MSHNLKIFLITRTDLTLLYAFSNGGMVVTSTILAAILFKEKLTPKQILCFVMSTVGLVLITGIGDMGGGQDLIGILFGLGAACLELMFYISMYGELLMALFLYFYAQKRARS